MEQYNDLTVDFTAYQTFGVMFMFTRKIRIYIKDNKVFVERAKTVIYESSKETTLLSSTIDRPTLLITDVSSPSKQIGYLLQRPILAKIQLLAALVSISYAFYLSIFNHISSASFMMIGSVIAARYRRAMTHHYRKYMSRQKNYEQYIQLKNTLMPYVTNILKEYPDASTFEQAEFVFTKRAILPFLVAVSALASLIVGGLIILIYAIIFLINIPAGSTVWYATTQMMIFVWLLSSTIIFVVFEPRIYKYAVKIDTKYRKASDDVELMI